MKKTIKNYTHSSVLGTARTMGAVTENNLANWGAGHVKKGHRLSPLILVFTYGKAQ